MSAASRIYRFVVAMLLMAIVMAPDHGDFVVRILAGVILLEYLVDAISTTGIDFHPGPIRAARKGRPR